MARNFSCTQLGAWALKFRCLSLYRALRQKQSWPASPQRAKSVAKGWRRLSHRLWVLGMGCWVWIPLTYTLNPRLRVLGIGCWVWIPLTYTLNPIPNTLFSTAHTLNPTPNTL